MKKESVLFSSGVSGIVTIMKKAWKRLSDHFVDYIKVYIVMIGSFIVLALAMGGISLSFFAIAKSVNNVLLYVFVVPLLLASFFGFIYLATWTGLAIIDSIIGKINIPIRERFTKLRPRVIGYIWFNAFFGLFMLGLIPFGIITLGILFLFWFLASSFVGFIYLEHKEPGMMNLWISRHMMKNQFLRMIALIVIVYGIVFTIDMVLLRSDHIITNLTSWFLNIIAGPYLLALKYEIYKEIPYPNIVETPKRWLLLSKVGFVVLIVGGVLLFKSVIQTLPNLNKLPSSVPVNISPDKLI